MTDPGRVWPSGEVPTTVPYLELLYTELVPSATWKPASRMRLRASLTSRPDTLGTFEPGAPSTKRGSVGGRWISPKSSAIGCSAVNQVRAGSLPPSRAPLPQCRSGQDHRAAGV